jgi:hypothetical protein
MGFDIFANIFNFLKFKLSKKSPANENVSRGNRPLLVQSQPAQMCAIPRDSNSGMSTGTILYPCVAPIPDTNQDGYITSIFFTRGNLTGTRYFTTAIILGCE